MAISQKKYAAELVDHDGTAFKFDDIGCMFRFVKQRALKDKVEAWFVTDYRSQRWLPAENATRRQRCRVPWGAA
jgi:copper chaperone NosL